MFSPLDLTGKTVLVTGASSGIGRGVAVMLSKLGARLILAGRREGALQETQALCERPDEHTTEMFDLMNVAGIPDWVKQCVQTVGRPLDGLVHSAGIGSTIPLRALSDKAANSVLIPNLHAALALLRGMSAKGVCQTAGGSVVLISSVAGLVGEPSLVAYSASKGALQAAARSAALELAPRRIRVNCVAPGYVETPMLEQTREVLLEENYQAIVQKHPLGIGSVDDVAAAIAYLLSDGARWVTGTTLVVDGGYTA